MEEFDERAIFARGPVVVFRWRNAPGWPVEYVSPNASEVFGHTAEDFVSGRVPYASLIHEDDAARVAREVTDASSSEASSFVHAPYRIRHREGAISWLHDVTRIVRGADGTPTHFFGYVVDVTSRVAAEEQARELERRLLHAQKLESLGVLAGGIAHDFNNLLTGILGQASLARRVGKVDSITLESLEQIELLARRAAELTRQLLSYSGRGNVLVEPVDLGELVDETVSMLGLAVSRTTTLVVERGSSLPAIDADRAQIQQVVMNLLTNAGEALDGRAGRVTLRLRAEAGEVLLEVEDTGRGLTEEVRQKLFDPFFTTKGAGRGLGLSAVLGIVRAHGGRIDVRSQPDVGSNFSVTFPASPSRPRRRADSLPPAPAQRQGTVLVVDDERAIRRSVRAILEHAGYRVLEAADGQEGLTVFDRHREAIALVLLDLTMPGMSGPETFVAIRERSKVPIVLTSGFSARHDAVIERASAFLQKPYTADDLERTLAAVLAG
jgi:two-component system cell cycle sensor histidine kinase/response regulator CckA